MSFPAAATLYGILDLGYVKPDAVETMTRALVQGGVVEAMAGRHGGYRLTRPAAEISLLDVIRAVEAPASPRACLLWGRNCSELQRCAVHDAWSAAQEALNAQLAVTRFSDLLR